MRVYKTGSNFNPLPSHEGRQRHSINFGRCSKISIHSPHTRGDFHRLVVAAIERISIHSPHTRGDATRKGGNFYVKISIHSPHTRGDAGAQLFFAPLTDFNPLPSHEGRPWMVSSERPAILFQSTPLTRGETYLLPVPCLNASISIHSPHTRGDAPVVWWSGASGISIHSPHTRGDAASADRQ